MGGLFGLAGLVACGEGASPASQLPEGKPLHAPANFDPSLPGYVACSSKILEGDVVGVADGRPGRMVATIDVDHWVKPAAGPTRVRLNLVDIAAEGVYHRWAPGQHLRLAVDVDPFALPSWQFQGTTFAAIERAVPQGQRLTCPYGPR